MRRPLLPARAPTLLRGLLVAGAMATGTMAGMLPAERLNRSCRWTEVARPLPAAGWSRGAHLGEDTRVAHALAIRFADSSVGRNADTPARRAAEQACHATMLGAVARAHAVGQPEVESAVGRRPLVADLFAIFLPMLLSFVWAGRHVVQGVVRSYDRDDTPMAVFTLAVMAPLVCALGVASAHLWEFALEGLLLRDGHVGSQSRYLPVARHAWSSGVFLLTVFAALVATEVRRVGTTPPSRPRPGSSGRRP